MYFDSYTRHCVETLLGDVGMYAVQAGGSVSSPLYRYVAESLVDRIASGDLAPGVMLPSESDLGAEFGVSQGTARKALIDLEQRGVVSRRQGVGTFVTAQTPESALFHFFRLRRPDGKAAIPTLVSERVTKRRARKEEREVLSGRPESVFVVERVRSVEGRCLVHETSSVPADLFPGLKERAPLPNTLYVLYQQAYSVAIVEADERIRAVTGPAEICGALGVKRDMPLLRIERCAIDLANRVVELRVSHFVTDGCSYAVSVK